MTPSLIETLKSHHSDSWGWALACCDWQADRAEDALQESYLRVLDGRASFREKSSSKTWFFGVIKRVSTELRRSRARHSFLNLKYLLPANEGAEDPPFDFVEEDQSNRQLREALRELSQRQREVLHLVFYTGLTLEESAHALGVNLGSVRTHYHRGKSRLAQLLELNND